MLEEDAEYLLQQLKCIVTNKDIAPETLSKSPELVPVQEALSYLSHSIQEANAFIQQLSAGQLEAPPPPRTNFLASSVKELHSGVRHLLWQTNQLGHGDYNVRMNHLGDFSQQFNDMVEQLGKREENLKQQAISLRETISLLHSIMDGLADWIIVTDQCSGEVIFANEKAQYLYYTQVTTEEGDERMLMDLILLEGQKRSRSYELEFQHTYGDRIFHTRLFPIQWQEKPAIVHHISDVTNEKEYEDKIRRMALQDELTGLYNRRHCLAEFQSLLEKRKEFAYCMIDLDSLKHVNDVFGHLAGDTYIKTVAEEMLKVARSSDVVCRMGGDEFTILFLSCSSQVALEKLHTVDLALGNLSQDYPMSISFGAIHLLEGEKYSPKEIMERADSEMYFLKKLKKMTKRIVSNLGDRIYWKQSFSMPYPELESNHKNIFHSFELFLNACTKGSGKDGVLYTLSNFIGEASHCLAWEEELFENMNYPDSKAHKNQHDYFQKLCTELYQDLEHNTPTTEFIETSLVNILQFMETHFSCTDKQIVEYIAPQEKSTLS